MGLFDNLISNVSSQLPTAVGNGLGDVATKVQEASSRITSMFGGAGPFSKVASIKETVNEGAAKYQLLASQTATGAAAKFAASNPFSYNAITGKTAEQVTQSQLEADATAAQIKRLSDTIANDHYVQLTEIGGENNEAVVFLNMPDIAESRTVEYEAVAPPQSPAAFQKYKGTASVQWTLNATLTSRTTEEASINLLFMNRLRGWTMPYFGDRSSGANGNRLGAPPPVLELKGWRKQMVGPVPVVITSLNWTFPQDVDYIPANELGGGEKLIPFPTVLKVSITMVETFSTGQMNSFDLDEFRMGNFYEAWRTDYTVLNELNNAKTNGNQAPAPEEGQKISPSAASSPGVAKLPAQALVAAGAASAKAEAAAFNAANAARKISEAATNTGNTTISSPTVLNALPPAAAAGAPKLGK
jgi:hypothetical protein